MKSRLRVILFSGGRGSGVLSSRLINNAAFELTLAVNGYDDGASTGEVRRFLGDSLGPSDFRKNASRLARELRSCATELTDLLDLRLPVGCPEDRARALFEVVARRRPAATADDQARTQTLALALDERTHGAVARRLDAFVEELGRTRKAFGFSDCSVGNLVFAGGFLLAGRHFNRAVADYCGLLGLPDGLLENVSDGTNAFLVALDLSGRLLGSEEEIVDAKRRNRIQDIFLIDRPLDAADRARLHAADAAAIAEFLSRRQRAVPINSTLRDRIATADVIIYSPGTQHSSLFPSYLTDGLSAAIAANLTAVKLLITNIQADAEITGSTAVDIIERAVYYLKEKGRLRLPTPSLITHYLMNDPGAEAESAYVPLGPLENLDDPRLIRIANYEDGVSGRHNAAKVLTPFLESFVTGRRRSRVAVFLHDADSLNKVSQTILEMIRGGIEDVPIAIVVFYSHDDTLDPTFTASLPFDVRNLGGGADEAFRRAVRDEGFQYVILFESSGMYQGEDVVALASHLAFAPLDAVWGSRRLSVREIQASYRFRYRHNVVLGAISYVGSHLLSVAYLVLYGRYISDTLSAARAARADFILSIDVPLSHKLANHHLLSALLRERAEVLETPVRFLPLSPQRVKRTTVLDGLRALLTILARRVGPRRSVPQAHPPAGARVEAAEEHASAGKV